MAINASLTRLGAQEPIGVLAVWARHYEIARRPGSIPAGVFVSNLVITPRDPVEGSEEVRECMISVHWICAVEAGAEALQIARREQANCTMRLLSVMRAQTPLKSLRASHSGSECENLSARR